MRAHTLTRLAPEPRLWLPTQWLSSALMTNGHGMDQYGLEADEKRPIFSSAAFNYPAYVRNHSKEDLGNACWSATWKELFLFCFILFNSDCANHWCGGRAGAMESAFNLLGPGWRKASRWPEGREVWISHPRCGVTAALLVCFSLSAHLEGELRVVFVRLGKRKCKWAATEVGLGMLPPLVLLHRLHHQRIPPIKAAFKAFFSGALSKYRQNPIGHAMPSWGIQTDGPCTSYEAQMRQWEDSKQLRGLDTVWWIIRDAFLWFRTRGEIFNCVAGYKSR